MVQPVFAFVYITLLQFWERVKLQFPQTFLKFINWKIMLFDSEGWQWLWIIWITLILLSIQHNDSQSLKIELDCPWHSLSCNSPAPHCCLHVTKRRSPHCLHVTRGGRRRYQSSDIQLVGEIPHECNIVCLLPNLHCHQCQISYEERGQEHLEPLLWHCIVPLGWMKMEIVSSLTYGIKKRPSELTKPIWGNSGWILWILHARKILIKTSAI